MILSPSTSDGPVLYTVTCDATLRIFIPVLDSPQYMQLHASLDLSLSVPSLLPPRKIGNISSNVFYLGSEVFRGVLKTLLTDASHANDTKLRRFQDICNGEWDMFMQVFSDGALTIRAVAASPLPVVSRFESHLSLEYRPATSDSPRAIQPSSINQSLSSSYTVMPSCCSWPHQTHTRISFSPSIVFASTRAFELLRLPF
jgi:hypothetical protein